MSYIYNLTDTWNAAGTTFAGIKMAVTNTASGANSRLLDLSVSGATTGSVFVDKNGNASLSGGLTLGTALSLANGGSGQTTAQAAINTFAGAVTSGQYLRGNGTNVVMSAIQAADVPTLNQNTTGTASNITGTLAVANGGTGLTSLATGYIPIGNGTSALSSSAKLFWDGAHLSLGADTSDIIALRIRSANNNAAAVQFTNDPVSAQNASIIGLDTGELRIGGSSINTLYTSGQERMRIDSSGNLLVGTTSAGTLLTVNGVATLCSETATPAAGSTSARLLFGTTAGFGIYYGSGAPTVSAAQGSIYLRSDGSSTSTRLYVNSSSGSGTTWTNVTTAA